MIFQTWAKRYWERNLSIIPCHGKRPLVLAWTKYTKVLPTEEELDSWIKKYPNANLGLVLGPASGLIALDIDSDIIDPRLPRSAVSRRGKKGEARFFKFKPGLEARKFRSAQVEILSEGNQVIIPPSIHPDTLAPYVWLGNDDFENAPEWPLENNFLFDQLEHDAKDSNPTQAGRNNKLKAIASAMLARGESVEKVAEELREEDSKHTNPLFTDKKEGFNDAIKGSLAFAESIQSSMQKFAAIPGTIWVQPKPKEKEEEEPEWVPPIPASGLLRLCYDYQHAIANDELPSLFLGGAIAMISALMGNKFVCQNISPNMYVFNVAKSGHGKSWAYELSKRFLGPTGIVGGASKSASALVQGLDAQPWRTRIDLVDEVAGLLKLMRDGGAFQTEMIDTLQELWSSGNKLHLGIKYAGKDRSTGAVWGPYHCMLASTNPVGLAKEYSPSWSDKGFLPRFLMMVETRPFGYKESEDGEVFAKTIQEAVNRLMSMPHELFDARTGEILTDDKIVTDNKGLHYRYNPRVLKLEPDAQKFISDFAKYTRLIVIKEQEEFLNGSAPSFLARHVEQIIKLAQIHAVSEWLDNTYTISLESVKWAHAIVTGQYQASLKLLEEIHTETVWGKLGDKIIDYLRANKGIASKSDIYVKFRHKIKSHDLKLLLDGLCDANLIMRAQITPEGKGRPITAFALYQQEEETKAAPDNVLELKL